MAGSAASIVLSVAEYRRLTSWVRAGTTPQRLVRRTRVVLGSASGLGSRALARREQMSRTTVRRWLARFVAKRCEGWFLCFTGTDVIHQSPMSPPVTGSPTQPRITQPSFRTSDPCHSSVTPGPVFPGRST